MVSHDAMETLSFDQYLNVAVSIKENTGYLTEYADGSIFYYRNSAKHSICVNNIINILKNSFEKDFLAISNLYINFQDGEYRSPDISIFCGETVKYKYENDLLQYEIPKLIFEVISETTENNDRLNKMDLYANCGVKEYILFDYKTKTVEQYFLQGKSYSLMKRFEQQDLCTLILFPNINFLISEIFNAF